MAAEPGTAAEDSTIRTDRRGVIRHWGARAQEMLGYTAEEAIGQRADLIIPPVLHTRHWRGFERAMANGHLRRNKPNLEVPALHKSGEIVPMRAVLSVTPGEDGSADGAQVAITGRGPAWRATAYRIVLAPLKLLPSSRGSGKRGG